MTAAEGLCSPTTRLCVQMCIQANNKEPNILSAWKLFIWKYCYTLRLRKRTTLIVLAYTHDETVQCYNENYRDFDKW